MKIAALFVSPTGVYSGLDYVDIWDCSRDARLYRGDLPVIAHPPCTRWGRFWHGSPSKPHQYKLGEDSGCFASALTSVRNWTGVLEHPAHSNAWKYFGLLTPPEKGGWVRADNYGGMTCYVEQGHYGHQSRKPTWLYGVGLDFKELIRGKSPQRLDQKILEKYGYEKARRYGVVSGAGGKRKTEIRDSTPVQFRDLLVSLIKGPNNV